MCSPDVPERGKRKESEAVQTGSGKHHIRPARHPSHSSTRGSANWLGGLKALSFMEEKEEE